MMRGTIQRWGNSQGIRIPKGALQIAQLREGDAVEITASEAQIVIRKARNYQSLDALFAEYAGDYRPEELDAGDPVGREVLE
jgi:antitoxin MazE